MRHWLVASIVGATIMPKYWCVNFDSVSKVCLQHGIDRQLWLMQYQYADDQGNVFQDGRQRASTTSNWRRMKEIKVGDKFVAYLPGNKFYAIGTVIEPRRAKKPNDPSDTIDEYVARKQSHDHDTGFVYYTPVFYEDFTDKWRHPDDALMRYAQRIDVDEWRYYVPDGVVVKGLGEIPPYEKAVHAVFPITKTYFDRIARKLAAEKGGVPKGETSFDGLATAALLKTAAQVAESGYFDLSSLADERRKKLREIVERRGQPEFRNKLIVAYAGRCTVTGCDAVAALEAAHIVPYTGPKSNHVTNGLLLRADIHTLFDLDLIGINPESLSISLAPAIKATVYAGLEGQKLFRPAKAANAPNHEALVERWKRFAEGAEL